MTKLFVKGGEFCYSPLPFGDKSVSHRALIMAAISDKPSKISNIALCDDVFATADCLRALGAKIVFADTTATVEPITKPNTDVVLDCKNSGTTARLMSGLVAGLGVHAVFVGDSSLAKRPMRQLSPLIDMGAKICDNKSDLEKAVINPNALFEIFPSKLKGITFNMNYASAQVKSAVLLAGLFADGITTVTEKISTRVHTENMLNAYGADIKGLSIKKSRLKAVDQKVPNDFSTAAFLIALGLKYGITITDVLLSRERTGLLRLLSASGAKITVKQTREFCGEAVGDLIVEPCALAPLTCTAQLVPDMVDEVIAACVTACMINGESKFFGLTELKHKESNRILSAQKLCESLGAKAKVAFDSLTVVGGKISGGCVSTFGDHRIAMAGVVGGILSENGVTIDNAECIGVSCKNFLKMVGVEK